MKCHYVHAETTLMLVQDVHPSAQLQQHIDTCEECREHYQQQVIEQWATGILDLNVQAIPVLAPVAQIA